jgi:Flp pilus assembly protein TadB
VERSGRDPRDLPVQVITDARRPHSDDQDARIHRYLVSMGIRTICVLLAVVVEGWLRWVFVIGAIGLPYVAVVMANARGEPSSSRRAARPPPNG